MERTAELGHITPQDVITTGPHGKATVATPGSVTQEMIDKHPDTADADRALPGAAELLDGAPAGTARCAAMAADGGRQLGGARAEPQRAQALDGMGTVCRCGHEGLQWRRVRASIDVLLRRVWLVCLRRASGVYFACTDAPFTLACLRACLLVLSHSHFYKV